MKTREEYEKLCDKTFSLVGESQANRIQIDLLLDIRDLLIWMKENTLYNQVVEERMKIAEYRTGTPEK